MELDVSAHDVGQITVIAVQGEVDLTSAGQLRDGLDAQLRSGRRRVVLDLDGVTFLDSTGLGVLVALLRVLRAAGGDARIACTTPRILRLFSITSLDEVFVVRDSVDSAVSDLVDAAPVRN